MDAVLGPAELGGEGDARARARGLRDGIDPLRRLEAAAAIESRLDGLPEFRLARAIGLYYSTGSEVGTSALIRRLVEEEGRRVFLPFLLANRLELSEWRPSDPVVDGPVVGMQPRFRRPVPLDEVEAIVVTGLAFDDHGRRLGAGSGHHDRLLSRVPAGVPRIGIQYSALVWRSLGGLEDREAVDHVVTELAAISGRRDLDARAEGT